MRPSLELRVTLEEVVFAELLLWMTVLDELDGRFPLEAGMTEEEDDFLSFWRLEEPTESMRLLEDFFVLLLDPFDFADVPLRVTLLLLWMAEDEDSSSFTDVLLSSPQAVRHNAMAKSMDPISRLRLLPG